MYDLRIDSDIHVFVFTIMTHMQEFTLNKGHFLHM